MENKQIVDGVDVSECEFCDWKGSDIPQCRMRQASFEPTCKGYNCYYKQLAREKRECAYWKKVNDDKNELLSKLGCPTTATARREVLVLQQQLDQLRASKEQVEQKLERIREVAKQMNNECFYDDFECKDCDMKNGCTYFNKSKILQIIKEMK